MEEGKNEQARQTLGLRNDHGLFINERSNTVVGYLFNSPGYGIYSTEGKIEVTAEQADTHNRLLSRGEILGLDENCQVGQRGTLYTRARSVITWAGELVSNDVTINGQVITFRRNGKVFQGRLQKHAGCFNFRRIR
jgi:hypothetical protein